MSTADVVVVLAAGHGKRMRSARPKVLHNLCGRPMLGYVVDQALALNPRSILVVIGEGGSEVRAYLESLQLGPKVQCVVQPEQWGTGHALSCCMPLLGDTDGRLVVLSGDMPLVTVQSLERLCAAQEGRGMSLHTAVLRSTRGFGRVIRDPATGGVARIVEERDANAEERAVREVNAGVYAFPIGDIARALSGITRDNAQGEYYLTDAILHFLRAGLPVRVVELDTEREAIGVNTLAHLAEARSEVQQRILEGHMEAGVFIEDPRTTFIDYGVVIGDGARILPCTVIRAGVEIGRGCEVGPFAHLRSGTVLAEGAEIGNFTEAKNAVLGSHTKAKHLSYLGDAVIGERTNIGAGTVFANYDGKEKHTTHVGDRAFIGSGTILVAPVKVGDDAVTGAGAVVTRRNEVPAGETWVGVPARSLAAGRTAKSAAPPATSAKPSQSPRRPPWQKGAP